MNLSGISIIRGLRPNTDSIKATEPFYLAPSLLKLSKYKDIKLALENSNVSISKVLASNTLNCIQQGKSEVNSTMLLYEAIGRGDRIKGDQSRIDHISISKTFLKSLKLLDFNYFFQAIDTNGRHSLDVQNELILPIIHNWQSSVISTPPSTCKLLGEMIWDFTQLSELQNFSQLHYLEPIAKNLINFSNTVQFPTICNRNIEFKNWINPAFLALRPLVYTSSLMLKHLSENIALQEELRYNKELRNKYICEVERMMNSFRYLFRQVNHDYIILDSMRIPKGCNLILDLVSANQDSSRWINESTVSLYRKHNDSISFGFGMLSCTGHSLTRIFLHILLEAVLDSFKLTPSLENSSQRNIYTKSISMRGYEKLFLKLMPF